MILYHGSNVEIRQIDLNKSARGKDFGKGFYLSENEKLTTSFEYEEKTTKIYKKRQ